MNTIDDGGPAFPFKCQGPTTAPEFYYGMTLRDWFAAHASENDIAEYRIDDFGQPFPNISRECARYKYADAMIKTRRGYEAPKRNFEAGKRYFTVDGRIVELLSVSLSEILGVFVANGERKWWFADGKRFRGNPSADDLMQDVLPGGQS